jgi:hypothetical protein
MAILGRPLASAAPRELKGIACLHSIFRDVVCSDARPSRRFHSQPRAAQAAAMACEEQNAKEREPIAFKLGSETPADNWRQQWVPGASNFEVRSVRI